MSTEEDKNAKEIFQKYPNGLPENIFESTWLCIWDDVNNSSPLMESELYNKYKEFATCHPSFLLVTIQKKITREQIHQIAMLRKETNGMNPQTLPHEQQIEYFKRLCSIIPLVKK
jgi:hypothetical protein